ncbi:MAG: histidine phosphatase family protein [Saprospiraceae bacterium]
MRQLFLIRHAKSSWALPGVRDFDRPLNDRGIHDAPLMAALLRDAGVRPNLIVSSPAKRAITTARFFANGLGIADAAIVQEPNIYEAFFTDIMEIIHALPDSAPTVLMFGHNPTFTDVANRFSSELIFNVPTCGIVRIESSAAEWSSFSAENARVTSSYFPKESL